MVGQVVVNNCKNSYTDEDNIVKHELTDQQVLITNIETLRHSDTMHLLLLLLKFLFN